MLVKNTLMVDRSTRSEASDASPRSGTITSVERSLDILQLLAGSRSGLRLAEVATGLGADRANALRILAAMESRGFVFRDRVSERYRLTFRITSLGFRHLEASGVGQWAQPILDQLAGETHELVRLSAAEGDGLLWIGRAQGAETGVVVDPVQGREVPLHATATGKAWLSCLPEDQAIGLVLRQGFEPRTPRTIRSVDELRTELRRVREQGYGTADEEADIGILAVAVAIVSGGRPVGTVSVAAPVLRATLDSVIAFVPRARRAAQLLGETWGPYVSELIPPVELRPR
jgi:IclR family transcriptional regulator, acetate operon repressor